MFRKTIILFLTVGVIFSCSSETEEPSVTDNFDRLLMLTHIADNIIIPSVNDFGTKMTALKSAGSDFTTTPNQTNLDALRTAWFDGYKSWQHIEMFDIGKAEELQYKFYMNIYPLTVVDVESNISTGSYDLNNVNNQDAQGFPALDYLLYGVANTDEGIIAIYTTATNNDNYKKYITDVLNQMDGLTQQVVTDWSSYRNTFVNSTDNTATSAVNKLVNDFIFYYEKGLRANKFGIPAGNFSTDPLPEKVEAFYRKDVSKALALEALNSVIDFFEGKYVGNADATRSSFNSYLIALEREDLATKIITQFNMAKTQINTLDADFYQQITTDNSKMKLAYDELQKAVVLLKVDMLQTFNINVDYVDADGD